MSSGQSNEPELQADAPEPSPSPQPLLHRLPTGIPGLDTVLQGGFLRRNVYLIAGDPGTGKTIMANQLCFNHVAAGGRAVYVTLLAESHAHMLAHMSSLSFYTPEPVGRSLIYVSGYGALLEHGLDGLMTLLRTVVRDYRPSVLVVDGWVRVGQLAESPSLLKEFLHTFHIYISGSGTTAFVLTIGGLGDGVEYTTVDGVVHLVRNRIGMRAPREIEVLKLRGSGFLDGSHFMEITKDGLKIHPRVEAVFSSPPAEANEERVQMPFGVSGIDEMLKGGVLSGTSTVLLGPPGSGKTIAGLAFLAEGARRGEPSLYFGFHETPPRLVRKADAIGLGFTGLVESGAIHITWRPPLEDVMDLLAEVLLNDLHKHNVRRLFIDGLDSFASAAIYPDRVGRFFTALSNELRARDVTTLFSVETAQLFGPALEVPLQGAASMADNIIFLRYTEISSRLRRLVSILKLREGDYDGRIREYLIAEKGIEVAGPLEGAEDLLSGLAKPAGVRPRTTPRRPGAESAD